VKILLTVLTVLVMGWIGVFVLTAWLILRYFYDDWQEQRTCRALGREVDRMARGR
jgi:hypothetical protein